MANYSKVQFISWELYTGTAKKSTDPSQTYYSGLSNTTSDYRTDVLGQCWDIEARLAFIADAMRKAFAAADPSPTTLKLFIAPEFLCRGAGGAYLHDLIDGWVGPAPSDFGLSAPYDRAWGGLFGGMQDLAAKPEYEHGLFVFGTAITASFPTAEALNGQFLLDPTQPGEVYNTALIQRGGEDNTEANYASRKQYMSGIDFLKWSGSVAQHTYQQVHMLDPEYVIPADVLGVTEGGARFRIAGIHDAAGQPIDFGIEICLDHAKSGGNRQHPYGRLRTANQWVKIQLVPSAGMGLMPPSIRLLPAAGPTPHAYAINCDGYTTLENNVFGSHTQIWNGANGADVPEVNRLVEVGGGDAYPGTQLLPIAEQVMTSNGIVFAKQLWGNGGSVNGAGHVRVMPPLDL
ncbi:hypothetical protein H8K52_02440 [Undibacterium seohonense]|uniref:Uncharacterized protein n=1 Tax=Undibacterium seohonense TaxID=1344950 RepID=A0ABR6X0M4_9BURK|nr:hypothetical protein [Undibacterium seohonense]MBC3806203.1 hypothetical protein [Undibacterium seohonense]